MPKRSQTPKLISLFLVVSLFLITFVSAQSNCWSYTTNSTCDADSSCTWKSDDWGSWCEELGCWSLWSQQDCETTPVPNKNCTWSSGGEFYSCEPITCWALSGTSATTCENNTAGISCTWSGSCYNIPGSTASCSSYTDQSTCTNVTGCTWGSCNDLSCYDYTNQTLCNAAIDPWSPEGSTKNCTWSGSSCGQQYCSDYTTQSTCNSATGISCTWNTGGWCEEVNCWNFDFTDAATCENNTAGLDCSWSGSWCDSSSCWDLTTNSSCSAESNCVWKSMSSSGWCEEVNCWMWDSIHGRNQSDCESNVYNLSCNWDGNPPGNPTNGWCNQDLSGTNCSTFTTEGSCISTYYCWWEFTDPSNASAGGSCTDPDWAGIGVGGGISNEWNPGCYIFDFNSTMCNNIFGCNFTTNNICEPLGDEYGTNITFDGIQCSYINDSELCNSIPALSSCCTWQNSSCTTNYYSTSCYNDLDETPNGEGSCDDADSRSDCETIAGPPWYMPCEWDNSTSTPECVFKADDVFGNTTHAIIKIENKRNCEAAGGKWLTENYCEGNKSIPTGRCEYKFDDEDNCDKACFACELKDSDGNDVDSSNAAEACFGSALGFCEFDPNTNAPNGIGYCKANDEWGSGVAGDCDSNCGDCTYLGNPTSNTTSERPSYFCQNSFANPIGGGCKWIVDNETSQGGYCLEKGALTCEDACDRCYEQEDCSNIGRTALTNGTSGSCTWQGSSSDGACVPNIGEDVEICWNGVDDTDNGLVDCADPSCYADSFCGLVSGDCFGWTNNNTCISEGCEWVTDSWNPTGWCDFPGSQCWRYDINSSECGTQANCQWSGGSGSGFCEVDWGLADACFGANETACPGIGSCVWQNDTWCDGDGSGTDWCNDFGGWCDYSLFAGGYDCFDIQNSSSCNAQSSCSWKIDEFSSGPRCEVDLSSSSCDTYINSTDCTANGCWWSTDGPGFCEIPAEECWHTYNSTSCNAISTCEWKSESWGGSCEPKCFSQSVWDNQTACEAISICFWQTEPGWCENDGFASCSNETSSTNQTICESTTGCRWKEDGWCDPAGGGFSGGSGGGGGIGAVGANCYKYDGNETLCTDSGTINISCGWFPEQNPFCEVDWGSVDCWEYSNNATACISNNCWFQNDSYGSFCTNIMDQCWMNISLQTNSTECNANAYCNSTSWGGCEPTCFSATDSSSCPAGCKWVTGWCNPEGMIDMFDEMEGGAPVPLGGDDIGETSQASVDIVGFGMKDMGDAYGFGISVLNLQNSSICNKKQLQTGEIGVGNESAQFLVYLDTDGSSSGSCSLSHNSSATGYEFKLRYSSQWNANTSTASETFTAQKCDNSDWTTTDLQLSAWKKLMCSEIGGGMIAIEKSDLARFPTLYDSTADIRVYVVTIGETGSVSSPSDEAGPGYTTPGAIDFEIMGAFEYGADTAKYEDILRNGFIKGEDCFNSIDDDNDGNADCNDWDCQYSSACTNTGVNAEGYVDTTSPKVSGVKIEEYPDSALILYDTTKPTNGTLEFYGNDSRCEALNATVLDIGILRNDTVREYKLWHKAEIYDSTLGYTLTNNTQYYYKLKVCDSNNKCALSRCSSFYTAPTADNCGFCNFVTRIKTSSDWNVYYDLDQDETYEHHQGNVCGPNAGMKTNYTSGRRANIKMNSSNTGVYFEFINVSLTKTALNDKVRTITDSGDIISSSTLVGLSSETRDKIINNLFPEVCRIKIPYSGTCDTLYHCDDDGDNCVDRTSSATLLNSTDCVWEVPYCEFSTYSESISSSSSSSSSSGGGGGSSSSGGGGGATPPASGEEEEPQQSLPDSGTTSKPTTQGTSTQKTPTTGKKRFMSAVMFDVIMGVIAIAVAVGVFFGIRSRVKRKKSTGHIPKFGSTQELMKTR